jgi:hypothetical protein
MNLAQAQSQSAPCLATAEVRIKGMLLRCFAEPWTAIDNGHPDHRRMSRDA